MVKDLLKLFVEEQERLKRPAQLARKVSPRPSAATKKAPSKKRRKVNHNSTR